MCKINNHEGNQPAEVKQRIDGGDCVATKYRDKKQVWRIPRPPTHFQSDAAIAAVGTSIDDTDPDYAQYTTASITNKAHSEDVQATLPNVNDQLFNSQISSKNCCIDARLCGEQLCCCIYCVSECKKKSGFYTFCIYRQQNKCRDYYQPGQYQYYISTNDTEPQCSAYSSNNNNCELYKNRNSNETTIRCVSKAAIGNSKELDIDTSDVHSIPKLCIDVSASSPHTWAENDKLLLENNNNQTDLQSILESKPRIKQHLTCNNHSESCSDCIESTSKPPLNNRDRRKLSGKYAFGGSRSLANADCDKKLVYCTKRVTAQREIAKVFTVGLTESNETSPIPHPNENIANDSLSDSIHNTPKLGKSSNNCFDFSINNLKKNRLTSVSAAITAQPPLGHKLYSKHTELNSSSLNDKGNNNHHIRLHCQSDCDWGTIVPPFNDNTGKFCIINNLDIAYDSIENGITSVPPIDEQSAFKDQLNREVTQRTSVPKINQQFNTSSIINRSITTKQKPSVSDAVYPIGEEQHKKNQPYNIQIVENNEFLDGTNDEGLPGDTVLDLCMRKTHRHGLNSHGSLNYHEQIDCETNSSDQQTITDRRLTAPAQKKLFHHNSTLQRRASYEYLSESSRENLEAHHRRTNSSDATEDISIDRFSSLNRDCIAKKLRLVQTTEHRYAGVAVSIGVFTFLTHFLQRRLNGQ